MPTSGGAVYCRSGGERVVLWPNSPFRRFFAMDHTLPDNRQVNNTLCCLSTLKQGPCLHLTPAGRMVGRPGLALQETNRCQRVQAYYSNGVLQNQGKCTYF
ncbi:MAG: hypothetical protein ACLVKS_07705 [Peptococcus niger]